MQNLTIKDFGPVQNVSLQIRDVTLLIGPQASGKSTIGKAVFFFKMLRDELLKFVIESSDKSRIVQPDQAFNKIIKTRFLDFWGPTFHLKDICIKYEYQTNVWIEITLEPRNKYIDVEFSQLFRDKLEVIFKHAKDYISFQSAKRNTVLTSADLIDLESQRKSFFRDIQSFIYELFNEDRELLFIPAGRSLLATLADQIQYINPRRLDYVMRSFVDRINLTRSLFNKSLQDLILERKQLTQEPIHRDAVHLAENLIEKILKGSYRYDRDGEKIYIDKRRYVKLSFSSSGQQESIWILRLLFLFILENQRVFLVIEEPEAHLYPEAQRHISQLISLVANLNNNQVLITTHTPYVLASFNNLILAGKIGRQDPVLVKGRIPSLLWLNYTNLFAGKMQMGEILPIMDDDLQLVRSEEIDSASQTINQEFDFLFQHEIQSEL